MTRPQLTPWNTEGNIHARSNQAEPTKAVLAVWKRGGVHHALYFPLECGHGDYLEWNTYQLPAPMFGWSGFESARAALDKFFEESWPTGLGTMCPDCQEKHHFEKLLKAAESALAAGLLSEGFAESVAYFRGKQNSP